MPSINEQHDSQHAAAVRAIVRESDDLRKLLEEGLGRLENNETFAANDFQKGAVRALIDLFRMVNGLANVLVEQASNSGTEHPPRGDAIIKSGAITSIGSQTPIHGVTTTSAA